ncbi:MAG: STAS domain-containing protein [Planctomycetaceae bacterium]|nr:STAS domain-containing protein [Planctomycetaceae bacterium]
MSAPKNLFEFERSGDILIINANGSTMEFRDQDVRNAYNDAYRLLGEPTIRHLLVDFSRLSYFGSTFVGILVRLARKVRTDGGEAVLCNLTENMQEMMRTLMLLENTKTDFYWVAYPNRQAALTALSPPGPE